MEIKNAEELLNAVDKKTQSIIDPIIEKSEKNEEEAQQLKGELIKVSDDLVKANESLNEQKEKFKEWEQKQADGGGDSGKVKTLADELGENRDQIKALAKRESSGDIYIKADTVRDSVANNANALDLNGLGQLAHANLTAYDIFNKIRVSDSNTNGTIRYQDWDSATTVRAANMIAEGGTFPESTAKWTTHTLTIQKIGDTLPVSEEFFEDDKMFADELELFLETNVKIKRNDQIVNGNGTAPNLNGIVNTVGAYTALPSGITDANIYDLLVKVSENITSTGGSKYAPNFVLMNIADINNMKLKKDANNNYIIPPFVSRDGKNVSGMIVLEENAITANSMVVGDSRFTRIYEYAGMTLSRGMVNNQFNEDMQTLKVRTRLAFLIRNADLGGFKKVTDIDTALTTLAG